MSLSTKIPFIFILQHVSPNSQTIKNDKVMCFKKTVFTPPEPSDPRRPPPLQELDMPTEDEQPKPEHVAGIPIIRLQLPQLFRKFLSCAAVSASDTHLFGRLKDGSLIALPIEPRK
jgi:hypothetical protein